MADGYEVAHVVDQGLDPGRPDQQVSSWSYVSDFLLGLFAGDFVPRDSMAWLSGYLCSGGLSLIPVVGWILGGIADIRDTIAALIHTDWVGAGLSILGVVPYVGDAVAIPGKAARFVLRFTLRLDDAVRFIAKYDKIPDSVKTSALKTILGGEYTNLLNKDFTDATILFIAKGERTSLSRIVEAMSSTTHAPGIRATPQPRWRAGEAYLRNTILAGQSLPPVKWRIPENGPNSSRTFDGLIDTPAGKVAHEVKTGSPTYGDEVSQCRRDAMLRASPNRPEGTLAGIHWHFIAHRTRFSLGPSAELLACLIQNGITFTIHPPT